MGEGERAFAGERRSSGPAAAVGRAGRLTGATARRALPSWLARPPLGRSRPVTRDRRRPSAIPLTLIRQKGKLRISPGV